MGIKTFVKQSTRYFHKMHSVGPQPLRLPRFYAGKAMNRVYAVSRIQTCRAATLEVAPVIVALPDGFISETAGFNAGLRYSHPAEIWRKGP
jgi:hypothetical protein